MPAPTTGILDAFNRADALLAAPDYAGPHDGNAAKDTWTVLSNQAGGNRVGAATEYTSATYGPDCEGYATIAVKQGTGSYFGIFLRLQSPGSAAVDGYSLYYTTKAGTDSFEIYRMDNNAETQIGAAVTLEVTVNDVFFAEAVGSNLSIYLNGTLVITRSDATYAGAGNIGLYMDDATGRIDDFGGGTIGATKPRRRTLLGVGV